MKLVILATLALVVITSSAPSTAEKKPPIEIISYTSQTNQDGSYSYSFQTSDGSSRQETGVLKQTLDEENKPQNVIVVQGSYTYLNAEGKSDTITYFADDTGFHADGPTIPKTV